METDGCTQQQARDGIWMMDIDGLLVKNRPEGNLEGHKIWYAKDYKVMKTLIDVVKDIKPTVLIGKQVYLKRNDLGIELKCLHRRVGGGRSIYSRSLKRDGKK